MENEPRTTSINWHAELKAWRESGLSLSQYCREQGLVAHQLTYYKRKYDSKDSNSDVQSSGFTQVGVLPATGSEGLSLRLASGHIIEGISADTLPLVNPLLRALS